YLHYYHRVHGMDYAALRYSNVYGPRQDPHGEAGVVAIFSTRLLRGESLTIFGDGEQTRDYVYVGDVVAANLLVTDLSLPRSTALDGRAFNVGTGIETSVRQLASTLASAAERPLELNHAPARLGELLHSSLETSKLRQHGWSPATDLRSGLGATYRWIAERS